MNKVLLGKVTGDIDVKRFYLPGVEIKQECPKCGYQTTWRGNDEYISYPDIDKPISICLGGCLKCDHEFHKKIIIEVLVSEVTEEKESDS